MRSIIPEIDNEIHYQINLRSVSWHLTYVSLAYFNVRKVQKGYLRLFKERHEFTVNIVLVGPR